MIPKLSLSMFLAEKQDNISNLKQFELLAKKKLPISVFNFFYGGAEDELSLRENLSAFDKIKLMPRVCRGVSETPDLSTRLFGQDCSLPVMIAPMAFQKLIHPHGEIAVSKASGEAGIRMALSMLASSCLEEIKDVSPLSPWFQVYVYKEKNITRDLIKKATCLGYGGIVLTVDMPVYSKRLREIDTPLQCSSGIYPVNLVSVGLKLNDIPKNELLKHISSLIEPNISWDYVKYLRTLTNLPIVLKGILHPYDVELAIENGVDGIILSNHGGRQLDTAITPLESLQMLTSQIKKQIDIVVDGGIRKGMDILKALALGAKGVMIGRPIMWGLTCNGEEGVTRAIEILKQEMRTSMMLCGFNSVNEINDDILYKKYWEN